MSAPVAVAHFADSRADFFARREELVLEELAALAWLREEFHPLESAILRSQQGVKDFAGQCQKESAQSLILHLPTWSDPIFSVRLASSLNLPILILGNSRPETSSMVGLLGVGGALDQVGLPHSRVFEHGSDSSRRLVRAFIRAAAARSQLRGQTLGLFGGRSLGILTAEADAAQWQRLFGVNIELIDQLEIVNLAESLPQVEVDRHKAFLLRSLGRVSFGDSFTPQAFERQVRSYLATRCIVERLGLDFVGVKCQPELSDGYVTQCIAHLLFGCARDAGGDKPLMVHACESDADGALTMRLLSLLSEGRPAALLDVRWLNPVTGLWTLANCGAIPAALGATPEDPVGLSRFSLEPHVFGRGGGGVVTGLIPPQPATLARLCRKNGEYWMAIVSGEVVEPDPADLERITPAFPKAFVRSSAGVDFLSSFGSNHIHLVSGDLTQELVAFCRLAGIPWKIWNS
ncbi:MAG TPA: hypothetical protein VMT46_15645 [Anaerolineaceae bacterium]|nr:hypothetical protein [Anaerolineaceae bacterium]